MKWANKERKKITFVPAPKFEKYRFFPRAFLTQPNCYCTKSILKDNIYTFIEVSNKDPHTCILKIFQSFTQRFSHDRKNVLTLQYRYIRQNVVALPYVTRFRNVLKSLHRYNKIEIFGWKNSKRAIFLPKNIT